MPTAETIRLRGRVRIAEIVAQRLGGERFDRFPGAENRTAERMILPEPLREDLVDQIVGRVLDHLDLFDDDLLFALDVVGR